MMDFNASPEEMRAAHERRLQIRAQIREHNNTRPRCSGCGCDMPLFADDDIVTAEQYADPGYEYLRAADFRPGDLICFWCITEIGELRGRFIWGRA